MNDCVAISLYLLYSSKSPPFCQSQQKKEINILPKIDDVSG